MRRRAVGAIGVLIALTACASTVEPTPVSATVPEAEATRGDLRLSAIAVADVVSTGDAVEITATLEQTGHEPQDLTGSGSGLVFFSVTRLEDGLSSGPPGSRGSCMAYTLRPDEPMVAPFSKSGGYSRDDPHAEFMDAYFAEPELTLPPGTWRIDVSALGNIGHECGGDELIDLAVELVVFVAPADG